MKYINSSIRVAVTQRVEYVESHGEIRDTIDQKLSQWLTQLGFLPFPVPNILAVVDADDTHQVTAQLMLRNWLEIIQPNALLLSGGNDIGECPERDATECFLLSCARDQKIPVLGICRGMQFMAVWAGGRLIQVENHIRTRHQLIIDKPNVDLPCDVNSFHQWGLDDCPPDFEVIARADDGVIEAIRHKQLPWEGWMWHPERESPFTHQDSERLKALLNG
jgi:gamma-glutamyl-gamma-aminobutyrate hydrolase PuuD